MPAKSYARQRVSLGRAGALAYRSGTDTRPVVESSGDSAKTVTTVYNLQHSTVTVQETPNGPIARIEREDSIEYAGPLSLDTLAALTEVAE